MERREFFQRTGRSALAASLLGRVAQAQDDNRANATKRVSRMMYSLQDGWIHHWLVTGRQAIVIPNASYKWNPELRPAIVKRFYKPESQTPFTPVEGDTFQVENTTLDWKYYATPDDHLVDLAVWYGSSRYVRAWAFVELHSRQEAKDVVFHLFTNGPCDVWLNQVPVHRDEAFDYVTQRGSSFKATLQKGRNTLLVRLEHVMQLGGPLSLGVRLDGLEADVVHVEIPTRTVDGARRQALEEAFQQVHMSRDVYGPGEEVRVFVPTLAAHAGTVPIELWSGKKKLHQAVWDLAKAGVVSLGKTKPSDEGVQDVVLVGDGVRRKLNIKVFSDAFSLSPQGTDEERRQIVLKRTARHGGTFAAQVARMELGRWGEVELKPLRQLIRDANQREDGADGAVMNLLGLLITYGQHPSFPPALRMEIQDCLLKFKYWQDEPGSHSMNFGSENHQLTFHTAEILAGELYPDRTFTNNGKDGNWHRKHGTDLAMTWLEKRLAYGFEEWDANGYLMSDISILSHLRLSKNPLLQKGALQLLNKIVFGLAFNTFQGTYGSTHGRTDGQYIKNARNDPSAPVAWLLWGVGTLNHSLGPSISLAAIKRYELPEVLRLIALDQPQEMWSKERQGLDPKIDPRGPGWVDKVTYKTPDFMLSSAQDWKPGERGYQQHIWQATLGLGAVVWVNHPAVMSENGNHRPNFWMGNITLPRTAQWKDALVSIHKMRPEDWLGWTHAYFPSFEFDEYLLEGDWAFARKNDGYLALKAQHGLKMVEKSDSAFRELRSTGRENVWLCQMGRKAQDGDFASFRQKVRALPVKFDKASVQWTTLRGQQMVFGWEGPLRLDGKEKPISDFAHFDNPYCQAPWPAEALEIQHKGRTLTIDIAKALESVKKLAGR